MPQYYMLHKPRGLLTAKRDARRETVMSCFPEALREALHPVGRLDKDTEGLLLFTDDGMLDVRLLRPERHVEKEYEYRAFGLLDEAAMRRLETGVTLLEGRAPSLPARAELLAHTSIGESAPYLPERFREKYLKNPARPVTVGSHGGLANKKFWGHQGICWSLITSAATSFRIKSAYAQYSSGSPTLFDSHLDLSLEMLAYLNSPIARYLLKALNPTINTTFNDVASLPYISVNRTDITNREEKLLFLSHADWDLQERSRDFKVNPLVAERMREVVGGTLAFNPTIAKGVSAGTRGVMRGISGPAFKVCYEDAPCDGKAEAYFDEETREKIRKEYMHPLWKAAGEIAKEIGGHGGMDYIMDLRWAYCLQNGLPLDMGVYDLAAWSSIIELTERLYGGRGRALCTAARDGGEL